MIDKNDKLVNEAVAVLLGYECFDKPGVKFYDYGLSAVLVTDSVWIPRTPYRIFLPTTDRNIIPEIISFIESHDSERMERFIKLLIDSPQSGEGNDWLMGDDTVMGLLAVHPREACIAILKACGKWKELGIDG